MSEPSARLRWTVHGLLAIVGVVPTLFSRGHVVGDGVDAFGTVWFYWWVRRCVERFGDPSWTDLFFYPDGKDIFADTGNNFVDAVLSVPFQWVFGPTLYSPLFVILLQMGNAVAFAGLARALWGPGRTAFLATVLWQVNPWILFELTAGRPTQGMAWFLPVFVLYLWRTIRGDHRLDPLWLGVSLAVAGWTYWFSGFFLVFLGVPLALAWLWARPEGRGAALGRLGMGAAVCLALVAPAAVPMWGAVGAGAVPGLDAGGGDEPRALANNVEQLLHGLHLMELHGAPLFLNPAWGLPLVAALLWPGLRPPGGRAAWVVALVVVLVLGLGAGVRREDGTTLDNPVYLWLYAHLPFFDRLWFPYRFASVAFVPAVVLIASLWERLGARTWVGALLVVAGLGVQGARGDWPFRHHDARPPAALDVLAEAPGGVVFLPMGIQHDGLSWQTFFDRPTLGGMGESAAIFWPDGYRRRLQNGFVAALKATAYGSAPRATPTPAARDEVLGWGFGWVILRLDLVEERHGPARRPRAVEAVSALLGPPRAEGDDVVVWRLDPAGPPAPADR